MGHLKYKVLIKNILMLSLIFFLKISNTEENKGLILKAENYFATNQACDSYDIIDGKKYCVKESIIPLNSCGKQSDWPCMDPEGCLGITQFIKE